jgi:hypothetical protein
MVKHKFEFSLSNGFCTMGGTISGESLTFFLFPESRRVDWEGAMVEIFSFKRTIL